MREEDKKGLMLVMVVGVVVMVVGGPNNSVTEIPGNGPSFGVNNP